MMRRGACWGLVRVVIVAIALVLTGVPQMAAAATDDPIDFRVYSWGCVPDEYGSSYGIKGGAWMKELGKSGVTEMRIKFLVYKQGGVNLGPAYQMAYRSGTFPNNQSSYRYPGKVDTYLEHTFSSIAPGYIYDYKIKLTWSKAGRDYNRLLWMNTCDTT